MDGMYGVQSPAVREYTFNGRMAITETARLTTELETLQTMITGCTSVTRAPLELDKRGVDYVATLRKGREIYIDLKARDSGCSGYWRQGPELALEKWSVMPGPGISPKAGWTLDEAKLTELVLFTFNPEDHEFCYLLPFQLLRIAFARNINDWFATYQTAIQRTRENGNVWHSQCVFVPVTAVQAALTEAMTATHAALPTFTQTVSAQSRWEF